MPVVLRPWSSEDAPALLDARWSNRDLDSQFGAAEISNVGSAVGYIAESYPFSERAKNWAIVADDVAVGNVGLSAIERRHDTAWMYYWLAEPARGNGYATRALIAVSDWAFANGLFRLELGHRTNNPASCRVATAAGFLAEGIERLKLRYGSERFDVETHARLATDPVPEAAGLSLVPPW